MRASPVHYNNLWAHGVQAHSAKLLGLCLGSPEVVKALLMILLHVGRLCWHRSHAYIAATNLRQSMERTLEQRGNYCAAATYNLKRPA